jgi:hypothetical protein
MDNSPPEVDWIEDGGGWSGAGGPTSGSMDQGPTSWGSFNKVSTTRAFFMESSVLLVGMFPPSIITIFFVFVG